VAGATLVAVGLLVVMMLVVEVRPAEATFPGKNGRIALTASDGHDYEIYTINASGGGRFQVTDNRTDDVFPSYSPNGKRIAYDGYGLGNNPPHEIYTISATGGRPFQLTHTNTDAAVPSYSPNGKRIAYVSYAGQDQELFTVKASGGEPFQVTHNDTKDAFPSWGSQ
jgi:Tol biopolymer transport system component